MNGRGKGPASRQRPGTLTRALALRCDVARGAVPPALRGAGAVPSHFPLKRCQPRSLLGLPGQGPGQPQTGELIAVCPHPWWGLRQTSRTQGDPPT